MNPYIINVTDKQGIAGNSEARRVVLRRAVATIEEARTEAARRIKPMMPFERHDEAMAAAVEHATRAIMHALGGKIGPLLDGTLIEVKCSNYHDLAPQARGRSLTAADKRAILAGFNVVRGVNADEREETDAATES